MYSNEEITTLKSQSAIDYINSINNTIDEGYQLAIWDCHSTMTALDYVREGLISDISDTFKSIHNIRPRWKDYTNMTINDLVEMLASLIEEGKAVAEEQKREEEEYLAWQKEQEEVAEENARWAIIQSQYDIQDSLMGF